MVQYFYILQDDHHNKSSLHPSPVYIFKQIIERDTDSEIKGNSTFNSLKFTKK